MGRRPKERVIGFLPQLTVFEPRSAGGTTIESGAAVLLGLDELEALRLAHIEGLEQSMAARALGISRPTFGRILAGALNKLARALVEGQAIQIGGGAVCLDVGPCICAGCGRVVPAEQVANVVEPRCPVCASSLRALQTADLEGLRDAQMDLLGDRLSPPEKRRFLAQALSLLVPGAGRR